MGGVDWGGAWREERLGIEWRGGVGGAGVGSREGGVERVRIGESVGGREGGMIDPQG